MRMLAPLSWAVRQMSTFLADQSPIGRRVARRPTAASAVHRLDAYLI
jgi:hypothetical protein